ncbi:MAG TPA: carboxypeptidase-like regulatory domain-containing protein [Cyclobacteriaceae bacterium]|nr:carboxypeptidase-like regulatory domain-containing protein [Cyclobacteriaceae bacterium]
MFGRVTDNLTGEPLPYATVSVAGKAIGTVTNSDGSFDLRIESVPESDTLLISMIGQEQFMHSSTENVSPKKRKKN